MIDSIDKVISIEENITIDGKVYKFKSLGVRGLGEFQVFCDGKYKKDYSLCCVISGKDVPSVDELMELSADEAYLNKTMNTFEGALHIIYIILKDSNKDMDIDEDYIKDNLNIEEINGLSLRMLGELKEKTKPAKNVKAKPRKKKK